MCGIVGYAGERQAAPILLDGLAKLEYRGYDSAGLAVRNGASDPEIVKAKGRLKALAEKTNDGKSLLGDCGIGHTRWATHGEPSVENAHPHCSDDKNVVAVHNGIIENYQELKDKLSRKGYQFYSETDTEVAVKLIDYYYKKYEGTPVDAINHALVRIRGSYALAIMFRDYPEEIYVARKDSPMILGVANGESYIGSDVPAILAPQDAQNSSPSATLFPQFGQNISHLHFRSNTCWIHPVKHFLFRLHLFSCLTTHFTVFPLHMSVAFRSLRCLPAA